LVVIITLICVIILLVFKANVNAQSGAYATGVLALIFSASVAVTLSLKKENKVLKNKKLKKKIYYFSFVSLVFAYTLVDNIVERPDGIVIACVFFLVILFASAISRWRRAFELRVESHKLIGQESEVLWNSIKNKKVNLVPISSTDKKWCKRKEEKIKIHYNCTDPLAFLAISLRDDRSEFVAPLVIKVTKMLDHPNNYFIKVSGAVAIPNTVAYISEQIDPIALYLGLARKNAMEQAIFYVLFGEGEIGLLTYRVLVQHWESTEEDDVRPVIFLMSD
jgi:Ca2+/Na+ antiporter